MPSNARKKSGLEGSREARKETLIMHGKRVRKGKRGQSLASSGIDARRKQRERVRGGHAASMRSVSVEQRGGGVIFPEEGQAGTRRTSTRQDREGTPKVWGPGRATKEVG